MTQAIRNIFFIGSSAVGKSTLTARVVADYGADFYQIRARDVHATIPGHSFEKAMTDPLAAIAFQYATGDSFARQAKAMATRDVEGNPPLAIAERYLLDVAGYSGAFSNAIRRYQEALEDAGPVEPVEWKTLESGRSTLFNLAMRQVRESVTLAAQLNSTLFIHVPVNPNVPYAIEPARPPESIRDECARLLERWFGFFRSEIFNEPKLRGKMLFAETLEVGDLDSLYEQVQLVLKIHDVHPKSSDNQR